MSGKGLKRLVVLISGSGSNLQAIIDACNLGDINAEIVAVISNKDKVKGLERAANAGIHREVLNHSKFKSREAFDHVLAERIDLHQPDLVILAGFMRILSKPFVSKFSGRMLNVHPSLLPQFQGLHTHRRALEAGVKEHGASIHFVTEELDGGPVVLQAGIPINDDDTEETLATRLLTIEHKLYPRAISWYVDDRLKWDMKNGLQLDNQPLKKPLRLEEIA